MKKIGSIRSILNNELVLVESDISLNDGDRLIVFVILESEEIKKQTGLKCLTIPKGELIVNSRQSDNIYLAATAIFEPRKFVSMESPHTSVFGSSLAASIAGLGVRRVETVESVPKTNPVPVDQNKNLNIKYQKEVTVGDAVAKKGVM